MANRFLAPIYSRLFHESFSYGEFSKRLKMQKGIYLLTEMGVPVGDYRFSWYKHGPYSQVLLDDMHSASSSTDIVFSSDVEKAVEQLSAMLNVPKESTYTTEDWAECLGSIHYLRKNVCPTSSADEDLLTELVKRKPHLRDSKSNKIALSAIQNLFS